MCWLWDSICLVMLLGWVDFFVHVHMAKYKNLMKKLVKVAKVQVVNNGNADDSSVKRPKNFEHLWLSFLQTFVYFAS